MRATVLAPRNERLEFILKSLVEGTLELNHPDEKYIHVIKSDIAARGYDIISEHNDDQNNIYHLHIRRVSRHA